MLIVLGAILVSFLVYANAVSGAFVYDDTKQIVQNQLIQDSRLFGKALTSDVWAFKGNAGQAWSNYWRPTFILWLIVNNGLFGLGSTAGWHLANIFLHALVVALAYGVLRQLRLSRAVAGVIVFIFAVHPVHVESVAWISGSPDLLMAAALLGALWLVLSALARPDWRKTAGALALFAIALLAKEVAIVFPGVVFVAAAGAAVRGTVQLASAHVARRQGCAAVRGARSRLLRDACVIAGAGCQDERHGGAAEQRHSDCSVPVGVLPAPISLSIGYRSVLPAAGGRCRRNDRGESSGCHCWSLLSLPC